MTDIDIQSQIKEMNQKLDLVLSEVNAQRLKRLEVEDLVDDLSIISKDVFTSTVQGLDNAGIDLDYDAVGSLLIKVIRNIGTFNKLFDMLESANDLMKDLTPIINQVGVDAITLMSEFEQKGYFNIIAELMKVVDSLVKNIKVEDVKVLHDITPTIVEIFNNITSPKMLNTVNNALTAFNNVDADKVKPYSMFKVMRKMNSKEMKQNMGFMMTFLEELSKTNNK